MSFVFNMTFRNIRYGLLGLTLTVFFSACSEHKPSSARDKEDINAVSERQTIDPIQRAIATGDLAGLKAILAGNPEAVNPGEGATMPPLSAAILRRKPEIAIFLIEAGADVNAVDSSERTPAHLAVERNLPELIAPLAAGGARLSERDSVGWTPLHWAAAKDNLPVARSLIEAGADVHARTVRGGTILHEAASTGSVEMVELCLDQGVDRSVVASDGGTALEVAREFQNEAAIQLLSQPEL